MEPPTCKWWVPPCLSLHVHNGCRAFTSVCLNFLFYFSELTFSILSNYFYKTLTVDYLLYIQFYLYNHFLLFYLYYFYFILYNCFSSLSDSILVFSSNNHHKAPWPSFYLLFLVRAFLSLLSFSSFRTSMAMAKAHITTTKAKTHINQTPSLSSSLNVNST